MREKVLLINDLPGYGKVALSAMMPIMSKMGYDIYNLPTALVSNTLDYGKFDILETTQYMKNTIQVWDELGFSFDAVTVCVEEAIDCLLQLTGENVSDAVVDDVFHSFCVGK